MLSKFFVTDRRTKVMAALLHTLVWDCTRPVEIRLGRVMMCVVGLNKFRHQAARVSSFVTSHTEWLMHPSLNGVYHFPGKNRHLNYSTMTAYNLAPKSLFIGHLNHMWYGECLLDMDGTFVFMTKAAGSFEVSVHMYQTTWHHTPQGSSHGHCCKKPKCHFWHILEKLNLIFIFHIPIVSSCQVIHSAESLCTFVYITLFQ